MKDKYHMKISVGEEKTLTNSIPLYDKNNLGMEINLFSQIKGIYENTYIASYLMVKNLKHFLTIRFRTRMFTLTTSILYCPTASIWGN